MQLTCFLRVFGGLLPLCFNGVLAQGQQGIEIMQRRIAQRLVRRAKQTRQYQDEDNRQYGDNGDTLTFAKRKPFACSVHGLLDYAADENYRDGHRCQVTDDEEDNLFQRGFDGAFIGHFFEELLLAEFPTHKDDNQHTTDG